MMKKHKFIPREKFLKTVPKKRIVAGAFFFNNHGQLLIVKTSYKDHWSVPGGIVDAQESPIKGCLREVKKKLG